MRMQVILDSSFARPGSAPIWGGKKAEFRDWTKGWLCNRDHLFTLSKGVPSSETQGELVGTGKSLKRAKKNSGEEKSRTRRRALLRVLDFSSPEFIFARFRLFPVPTNSPWVSEDGGGGAGRHHQLFCGLVGPVRV